MYRKRGFRNICNILERGNVENNWTINRAVFARIVAQTCVVVIIADKCELSRKLLRFLVPLD